jgi:phosphatidylglycerophosphate synthase
LLLAAALVIAAALADSADSGVAVLSGRTSGLGSFYDALADRCGEVAWLVALWLVGGPGALVAACGALTLLHEYARSRATLAGMPGVGASTVAERSTRVLAVVAALVLGAVAGVVSDRLAAGVVTVALAVWLVLALLGASRLFGAIRAMLRLSALALHGFAGLPPDNTYDLRCQPLGREAAKRLRVEREGTAEDGERAAVAGEEEVAHHVDEPEPAVEPPRAGLLLVGLGGGEQRGRGWREAQQGA